MSNTYTVTFKQLHVHCTLPPQQLHMHMWLGKRPQESLSMNYERSLCENGFGMVAFKSTKKVWWVQNTHLILVFFPTC